ncbi:MAG: hypothetical protein MUF49_11435, partial [Oculatellaceae cyanobacterium Prado106]|nr:hypothetical protein [Oculatellaceae cyanobacterium Prado106]
VVSGRGSLPPSPMEPFAGQEVPAQLATLEEEAGVSPSMPVLGMPAMNSMDSPLVEAQGWAIAPNGQVQLVAMVPGSVSVGETHRGCQP